MNQPHQTTFVPSETDARELAWKCLLRLLSAVCVLVVALATPLRAAQVPALKHRFPCADYVANKVAIIATNGTVEWEFPAVPPQDCWLLTNGNVLFCELGGEREVAKDKEIVWEFTDPRRAAPLTAP